MSDKQERIAVVQQFGRTYRGFLSAFEAQVGQPMPRWRILLAVSEGGRVSQKSLVEKLQIDAGALTRQLKSIEALGWIRRSVDERDNRVTNVELTDEGRAVLAVGMPLRNAFLDEVLADFPDSLLKSLSQSLDLLERRIAALSRGAAPP
jgi:MarR family transcriptional regulator, organic hydroperoxide resistance regulator